MRALRLVLAEAVIVVLLGGLGGVATAQDAGQTPVVVTGLQECSISVEKTCEVVDGVERCRGQEAFCVDDMSDPRVKGIWQNRLNSDCFDGLNGCIYWGTHVLDNKKAGWDCTWSGLTDPYPDSGNDFLTYGVCPGTGAYEGLTYTWYHVSAFGYAANQLAGFGDGTDQHGLIYADELASLTPPAVVEE